MPSFTEADIRAGATSQSFSRGTNYYHDGAVLEIARRGALITAEVEGSDYAPYAITIQLDDAGCIRHYNADILELFAAVKKGDRVAVVDRLDAPELGSPINV